MSYALLIIDDDEDIRLILSSVLASIEDLTILEAENGTVAEQIIQNQSIDGIILDYQLPDISGEELLQKFSSKTLSTHPKVIMLSARDDQELTARWLSQGASAVLKKPFNPFELLAQLRDHLEF